jgi:integrase
VLANQVLKAASAVFGFGVKMEVIAVNPCIGIELNPTRSRERYLHDDEFPKFWSAFGSLDPVHGAALRTLLLLGQRPGEVAHMRHEHIRGEWWEMPGKPTDGWPGTKTSADHAVFLPKAVRDIIAELSHGESTGFVFTTNDGRHAVSKLDAAMRDICKALGIENNITPHDLRRTHGTMVTRGGFGRAAMNRIQAHREGGIGSVYDRYEYADENKRIMEAVANQIMALVEGSKESNVVRGKFER